MKSLVIYYSKTGNTKLIAETIASELNAELLELKPEKDKLASKGFMLYFKGGYQSMTKKKIKLANIGTNFNNYDLIFLGTPVWAWRLNPVVRSFLKAYNFSGKKFGLFCCCAGSGTKILAEMKNILKDNEIISQKEFIEPLVNDTEKAILEAKNWAIDINNEAEKKINQ
ncbi:MAG: flavodoxin [Candidatus Heimdallarchaeota archaeon]|nr:flavodoxin [Candidatus Heimdallarchaeota archaeon]